MSFVYSKSIQNDLDGIVPNMRTVKMAIKRLTEVYAKYNSYTNFGDDISIYFNAELTPDDILQLDSIFQPGNLQVEPYTKYNSNKLYSMVNTIELEMLDVHSPQIITNKDLTDNTNMINHFSIGAANVFTSGTLPVAGQYFMGQNDGTVAFQYKDSFLASYSVNQIFPANTLTMLAMDTVMYNTNSCYTNPTATIKTTGSYRVEVTLDFSTVTLCYIILQKNGIAVGGYECRSTGSNTFILPLFLNKDDIVNAYVYPVAVDCDVTAIESINGTNTTMSYFSIN